MKLFLILILMSFGLHAQEYAEYQKEWMHGLTRIVQTAQTENVSVNVFAVKKITPEFSQAYSFINIEEYGKVCNLVLNVEDRSHSDRLFGRFGSSQDGRDAAITVVWAHEFGHCLRLSKRDYKPFETRTDSTEEGFADVYALSWVYQNQPEMFDKAFSFMVNLRRTQTKDVKYSAHWIVDKSVIKEATGTPYEIANKIVFGK